MEEPNAQSVGREFVRQYYTMLNEGPGYLHRFYSHNSSFLHGGVERPGEELEPAIGQSEIHKKIAQLEFHDCHAKIRQVDSQASVEGAVVIQVIGELSNRGQPMRRFMQTFVLAPQSPKKYYLHNDIFRYQDEVFQDLSPEVECSGDEIYGIERRLGDIDIQQQQPLVEERVESEERPLVCYYEPTVQQLPSVVSNGTGIHEESSSDSTGLQEGLSGGDGAQCLEMTSAQEAPGSSEPVEPTPEKVPVEQSVDVEVNKTGHEETEVESEGRTEAPATPEELKVEKVVECVQPQEPVPVVPAQKPTWAAMASRNTSAPVSAGPGNASGNVTKPQATIRPEPKTTQQRAVVPNGGGLPQRTPRTTAPGPQATEVSTIVRDSGLAGTSPGSNNNEGIPRAASVENGRGGFEGGRDVGDDSRRAGGGPNASIYPDTQQVFVGNVPHFIVDLELKEFFEQYGPVADIRINRKTSNSLPNFGFVSFETADAVQALLSARPLPKLNGKHRLNVEEKKAKEELARPRSSGPRAPQLGNKSPAPFNRTGDTYAPPAGRGRGGINNTGANQQNNGGGGSGYQGGTNNGGKGYNKSYTNDEGHIGTSAAGQAPSTQNNLR